MSVWNTVGDWTFSYFEPDIDPASMPGFETLVRLWQGKRGGRRVPSWSDFDFYDFNGWHGSLSVYDIGYDPFSWTSRLSGTKVDTLFQRSMQGLTRSDMKTMAVDYDPADAFYQMTCSNLLIAHTQGPLNVRGREFLRVEFLELPCSDGGDRATHTIELAVPAGS